MLLLWKSIILQLYMKHKSIFPFEYDKVLTYCNCYCLDVRTVRFVVFLLSVVKIRFAVSSACYLIWMIQWMFCLNPFVSCLSPALSFEKRRICLFCSLLLLTVQCPADHGQVKDTKWNEKHFKESEFGWMITTLIIQFFFLKVDFNDICTVGSRIIGSIALLNSTVQNV